MKSLFRIFLIGFCAQCIICAQADARGEIPPPPPFTGGDAGDWLGSGPIFGFEGDNGGMGSNGLRKPWKGAGGSNGGWGGSWWNGSGPLGGGGWGGWGGWGSGQGGGAIDWGGNGPDDPGDTSKRGHIWPDTGPPFGSGNCLKMRPTGADHTCSCKYTYLPTLKRGDVVRGRCGKSFIGPADPHRRCSVIGDPCLSTVQ